MDPLVPLSQVLSISNPSNFIGTLLIILVLIIFSAFFSATETAFSCCNRIRMKVKAEGGSKSAKLVMKVLDGYDRSLITLLIGNNIVNLTASSLATVVFMIVFNNNESLATTISTVVMTLLIFFFGESVPKNIAKRNPEKYSCIFVYPIVVLHVIFYPVMLIFYGITLLVKKIFHGDKEEAIMTEDEFQTIVGIVEEEGVIDEEESDIIQAAVDFGDITVKDVLTPIEKVFGIDIKKASRKELMNILRSTEFSRIPIYDGDIKNIIGIFHVRKFLKSYMKSKTYSPRSAISEPLIVRDTFKLDDMVDFFKEKKVHLAVVKNEQGETLGIVTMEDVLEELIGEQNLKLASKSEVTK